MPKQSQKEIASSAFGLLAMTKEDVMKEQDFELALERLEKIVEELEGGDLSLTDAIKKYEEGMKLSQFCTKKLHDIQKKIEILVKDSSGNITAKPFAEEEEEASDKPHKKARSEHPKSGKRPEELLF